MVGVDLRVRVGAVIRSSKNEILLLRYTHERGDLYCIPGGVVDRDEWLEEALSREIHEELSVSVSVGPLIMVAQAAPLHNKGATLHFLFSCQISLGDPILNPAETSAKELLWVHLEDLVKLTIYPDVREPIANLMDPTRDFNCDIAVSPQCKWQGISLVRIPTRTWL